MDTLRRIRGRADVRFRLAAHIVLVFFAMNPSVLFMGGRGASAGVMNASGGETSTIFYVLALACYALAALGILVRLNFNLLPLLRAAPVWLIVAFAFASALWSVDPAHTMSRSIGFLGTTLAAAFIATFPRVAQLRILALSFGIVLVASLLMIVVAPDLSISTYRGETTARGLFVHKNIYGWAACLYTLVILGAWRAGAISGLPAAIFAASGVTGVCLSHSASGIGALVAGAATMAVLTLLRRTGRARFLFSAGALAALCGTASLAGVLLPLVLDTFGKTGTLSGRTSLWTALVPAINERFVAGWGFGGALWKTPQGADFLKYEFFAGNAQGGYVENQINLGVAGSALFYIPLLLTLGAMLGRSNRGDRHARTLATVLATILFLGIVAPIFMPVNQAFWILIAIPMFERFGPLRRGRMSSSLKAGTPVIYFFAPIHRLSPERDAAVV